MSFRFAEKFGARLPLSNLRTKNKFSIQASKSAPSPQSNKTLVNSGFAKRYDEIKLISKVKAPKLHSINIYQPNCMPFITNHFSSYLSLAAFSLTLTQCNPTTHSPSISGIPESNYPASFPAAIKRFDAITEMLQTNDFHICYEHDDKVTFYGARSQTPPTRLARLEHLFASHPQKDFAAITLGKSTRTQLQNANLVTKLRDFFNRLGYKRIYIEQAGGGLARPVCLDYRANKKCPHQSSSEDKL